LQREIGLDINQDLFSTTLPVIRVKNARLCNISDKHYTLSSEIT